MAANPTYNDGALEYGSAILTITPKAGGDTFQVIADAEFSFDENSKRVMQTNQYGEPSKKFGIPELIEGSCTVQLPAAKRIRRGDTFTTIGTDDDASDGGYTWIVESASQPYSKEDYRKQTIKYAQKLNA